MNKRFLIALLALVSYSLVPVENVSPSLSWEAVQKKTQNAVVQIINHSLSFNWSEPYRAPEESGSRGSGFFINPQGYIVTNYHVVRDGAHIAIKIPFFGQREFPVELIGASPDRDIALLRPTLDSLKKILAGLGSINYILMGDSDSLRRGQEILAVGFPLGQSSLKTTHGMISGRERLSSVSQSCFQISAPINPGSSGGPALDRAGNAIGVSFAGISNAQNVGYIIPINEVAQAVKCLFNTKLLRKPLMGGIVETGSDALSSYFKNPLHAGIYLLYVLPGSHLDRMGIQPGDVLYEMNGFLVDYYGDITVPWSEDKVPVWDLLNRAQEGDRIDVVYYRNGERKEATATLDTSFILPIREIFPDLESLRNEAESVVIGGLVVMELKLNHVELFGNSREELKKFLKAENQCEPQLIVSHVQPTSLAHLAHYAAAGDIIEKVNGQKVRTLKEFKEAVLKTRETQFLSVIFQDRSTIVLNRAEIVEDEDRLCAIFGHEKSDLVTALAQE